MAERNEQTKQYFNKPRSRINEQTTLIIKGQQAELLGCIPIDILPTLYSMLESGKIRTLELSGKPLYYGQADITSIGFGRDRPSGKSNQDFDGVC